MNPTKIRNSLTALTADLRSGRVLAAVGLLVVLAVAIPLLLSRPGTPAALPVLPAAPAISTPESTAAPVSTTQHHPSLQSYLAGPAHNPFVTSGASTVNASTSSTGASASPSTAATTSSSATTESVSPSTTAASGSADPASSDPASSDPASSELTASTGSSSTASATGGDSASGTSGAVGTPTTVTTPAVTTTVIRTVVKPAPFADYEAKVTMRRVGPASKPKRFTRLSRFQLLPADVGPVVSFLGIRQDGQTAVFVLAEGVEVTGRGRCAPSTAKCTLLTLRPGQSVKLMAPVLAGLGTFTLTFAGVAMVTSSASVVNVDPSGRTFIRTRAASSALLRGISYGKYRGLLSIKLGATVPVAP